MTDNIKERLKVKMFNVVLNLDTSPATYYVDKTIFGIKLVTPKSWEGAVIFCENCKVELGSMDDDNIIYQKKNHPCCLNKHVMLNHKWDKRFK